MKTIMTPQITRANHTVDASTKTLGQLAADVAVLLRGKNKVYFVDHLDVGDFVNITNPEAVVITGRKMDQKVYYKHSGYLGGMKETIMKDVMAKDPTLVIIHAVEGMLPKNRLRKGWLKRLTFTSNKETK